MGYPAGTVVKTGTFLYDGSVACELRIVRSPVRYGTGDREDPPDVCNDQEGDFYYAQYGSPTRDGSFPASSVAFGSLPEAIESIERQLAGVRWHD